MKMRSSKSDAGTISLGLIGLESCYAWRRGHFQLFLSSSSSSSSFLHRIHVAESWGWECDRQFQFVFHLLLERGRYRSQGTWLRQCLTALDSWPSSPVKVLGPSPTTQLQGRALVVIQDFYWQLINDIWRYRQIMSILFFFFIFISQQCFICVVK